MWMMQVSRETQLQQVTTLIQPLGGVPNYAEPPSNVPTEPQYPSLIALNNDLLLATNGAGDIEVINLERGQVVMSTRYEGDGSEGVSPVPCVLLTAQLINDALIRLVVQSRAATRKTEFNIATLDLSLSNDQLTLLHMLRGSEVPVYCQLTPTTHSTQSRLILGSETSYDTVHPAMSDDVQPEDETVEQERPLTRAQPPTPPPYQWTQEGEEMTIQFALPSGTPKSAVSCQFAPGHLSLIVRAQDVDISYPFRKLWSTIRADDCTWTIDSDSGVLSLFLVKHDEHTRWPHVFDQDDGVLETMDAAKLDDIMRRLDKFTDGNTPFVQAMQHPVAQDIDEDIDESGQPVYFSVYDNATGRLVQNIQSSGREWLCGSFHAPQLEYQQRLASVCVKSDVDGQVYAFNDEGSIIAPEHVAIFDAFAFVHASKRDSRFVQHDPDLRFVTIVESNRNAYIYYRHGDKRDVESQTLIDVTQGHDVDILGAQLINDRVLMLLTETELVAVHI